MAATTTHPDYEKSLPVWSRARDVLAGEDAVKAGGEKYLPRLDAQSDEEYVAYKARASFFGATARTLEEYLDLIFRKAPVLAPGEPLKPFVGDCDLWGTDFVRYARGVVSEVLGVGRAGSLVLPAVGNGRLGEATPPGQGRPAVWLYRAEDILDWSTERIGGRSVLVRLALNDGERVRVLRLEDGQLGEPALPGGVRSPSGPSDSPFTHQSGRLGEATPPGCVQEVWKRGAEEWVLEERGSVKREGLPLTFIPFVFHGPRHSRPDPDKLPLADIIAANLDHYRLDADFKHGAHFAALPTAWVSGFDKSAPLRIGSNTAWVSEVPGASAGFLEFTGAGLSHLERAMEKVERRMAQLGARMLEGAVAPANSMPANGASTRAELCGLGSIVASLNQSLSRVLELAQWWIQGGELDQMAGSVSFAMNTDLGARAMSGEEITAVVAAWRVGAISRDTMLERLKRGEVLPDGRSLAEERALIHGKRGEG